MSRKNENFGEPIDRLLRGYEVTMQLIAYVIEIFSKSGKNDFAEPYWKMIAEGPALHWKDLRSALLKVHQGGLDVKKFVGPVHDMFPNKWAELSFAPTRLRALHIAEWARSSRRIYRVPKDLELLLVATNLEGVDWSMVKWPFDSFAISLEEPVHIGDSVIDTILVAKETVRGEEIMAIESITLDSPTPESVFLGDQQSRIERAIKEGTEKSTRYAMEKISSIFAHRMNGSGNLLYISKACFDAGGLASKFEEFNESQPERKIYLASKPIWRIVFGLILYLQSRPASDLVPKGWEKSMFERKEGPSRVIRTPSEVCEVKSVYSLTKSERTTLGPILRGGYVEVAPHHREGYWRRPPGTGSDPNQPKTVWVRPTIVRRDKLGNGELPIGSTEIV